MKPQPEPYGVRMHRRTWRPVLFMHMHSSHALGTRTESTPVNHLKQRTVMTRRSRQATKILVVSFGVSRGGAHGSSAVCLLNADVVESVVSAGLSQTLYMPQG